MAKTNTSKSRKPAFEAFCVREDQTGNSWWTKIGAAWRNSDDSISVRLSALPLGDSIILREPKKGDEE